MSLSRRTVRTYSCRIGVLYLYIRVASLIYDSLSEIRDPQKWRHARGVGDNVAGRAPGWSGPNSMDNKQGSKRYKHQLTRALQQTI